MAASIVQFNEGAQNTGDATVNATLDSAATAGNLIVLCVGSDDYNVGNPADFTLPTEGEQETFMGLYLWYKVATGGETTVGYQIGSAATSCWAILEISGLEASPFDDCQGQFAQSSSESYTTANITPTTGDRFLLALMGFTRSADFVGLGSWLNSFTPVNLNGVGFISTSLGSGTRDQIGVATRSVTGNGSTAFSTGATSDGPGSATSRAAIITSWKVAAAGTNASAENAAATGTANSATTTVATSVEHAAATGTGNDATATTAVAATAEVAAATGTAQDATTTVAPVVEHAAGTGTAEAPGSILVTFTSEHAAGTGTANDATVTTGTSALAEAAAGTGTAQDAAASVGATAETATAGGAASDSTTTIAPVVEHAAGAAVAHDATVATGAFTNAEPGAAEGTGTGLDATVATSANVTAESAAGTGTAQDAGVSLATHAEVATATGAAQDGSGQVAPSADPAEATGAAFDATIPGEASPPEDALITHVGSPVAIIHRVSARPTHVATLVLEHVAA